MCCNTAGGLLWTCACLKSRPLRLRFECERVLHCGGRTCSYSPFEHSSHQRTPAAVSPAPRNAGVDGSPHPHRLGGAVSSRTPERLAEHPSSPLRPSDCRRAVRRESRMSLAGCPRFPILRLGRVMQVVAQRVPQLDDPLGQSAEAAFGVAGEEVDDPDQADLVLPRQRDGP